MAFSLEAYDPYWRQTMPAGKFDTITCIYVLNVLTPSEGGEIIQKIKDRLNDNGKAYFAVRRDLKRARKGRGCIQRLVSLQMPSVRATSSYEIYEYTKSPR